VAFVTVKSGIIADQKLRDELRNHVAKEIGPGGEARRHTIRRGIAQDAFRQNHAAIAQAGGRWHGNQGDTTTLEDFSVLARLGSSDE